MNLAQQAFRRGVRLRSLPGRRIEDTWRFLRDALDDWLRSQDSHAILLQQAGALADDEDLADLRAAIYAERGRPEIAA